jgi:hypothetical protein
VFAVWTGLWVTYFSYFHDFKAEIFTSLLEKKLCGSSGKKIANNLIRFRSYRQRIITLTNVVKFRKIHSTFTGRNITLRSSYYPSSFSIFVPVALNWSMGRV